MRGVPAAAALVAAFAPAAFAPAAAVAAAAEDAPAIPPAHLEQAGRAQDMVDRLEAGDKTGASLTAARTLLDECLAAGNHRSARFLAGRIAGSFPEQLRDQHRHAEVLLASGYRAEAEAALRALLRERPTDCDGYALLSDLLLETGRPDDAMKVQAAHLKEHAGEAGPAYEKARIALWERRDPVAARAAVAEMRAIAALPRTPPQSAEWLRENASAIEEGADRREFDREVLAAAGTTLDRVLWGTVVGFALLLGAAGWFTRRKA